LLALSRGDEAASVDEFRHAHVQYAGEESPLIGSLLDAFTGRLAGSVAGAGLDADQDRRGAGLGRLQAAANLKLCEGTTRSSWSAVVISDAG